MTDEPNTPEAEDEPIADSSRSGAAGQDDPLRSLLRNALAPEKPEGVDMLAGVQERLRARSGGKFYGDGWSTSKAPPISTYLITSLLMLAVVVVVYAILAPLSGEAADMDTTPKPVNVRHIEP